MTTVIRSLLGYVIKADGDDLEKFCNFADGLPYMDLVQDSVRLSEIPDTCSIDILNSNDNFYAKVVKTTEGKIDIMYTNDDLYVEVTQGFVFLCIPNHLYDSLNIEELLHHEN